ncbi:GNAT family N-acetyltransferase [Catenulispora yoronensis]
MLGVPVKPGSAGEAWVTRLGFAFTADVVVQRLVVRGEDAVRPRSAPVAPGYRLVEWSTAAPEELIASYAAARQAIADAPRGGSSYREEGRWTPETIREAERHYVEQGAQERVAVAVCEADGTVAGLTIVVRYMFRPELGYQFDTAVMPAHRGRGLGLALKSAMLGTLRSEWPELERIHTSNNTTNTYMLAVNEELGFRPLRHGRYYELPTAQLLANLAQLPDAVSR